MKKLVKILPLLLVAAFVLAACGGAEAPPEPEVVTVTGFDGSEVEISIPQVEEGKTNVAFVYVGVIGDAGWTYAHNQGREYIEANVENTHTAYIEAVPEGADAERVIRSLARQGFDVIFTTSFGYMDPTGTVAEEFPDIDFVHVSGQKKAAPNFANVFGALEEMQYLSGMAAGAKAQEDGSMRVGYIAPFPIAEVVRLANATALGMRATCPECVMDIRWIFTWFDPVKEREAAESLLDAGSTVIITGADTPGPVQAAADRGLTGVAHNSTESCNGLEDSCLGVPYWNWGPVYADLVEASIAGEFEAEDYYYSTADGMVGFLGFMEGEEVLPPVPADVVPLIETALADMEAGLFTRFDIFTGPINNNQGEVAIPDGYVMTQSDLEGLSEGYMGAFGIEGREACEVCMDFLVEGFDETAEIPPLN